MKNQTSLRFGVIFAGLGLIGAPACGAGGPTSESSEERTPPASEARTSEAPAQLPAAQCVTIARGAFGNVADTQVASNSDALHPDANFGAGPAMIAGIVGPGARRALINWSLSALPPHLSITSATATLHARPESQGGAGNQLSVHSVTGAWSEGVVTWVTQPSYDPTVVASDAGGPGTHTFDLTALAQAWDTGANNGVLLEQNGFYETNFYTSENPTLANRPSLQVCYIPDLCAGVTCFAQAQCHNVGTCDQNTGVCSNPPNTGAACNDGNACTFSDTCQNGTCVGNAYSCNDGNPCTNDVCTGNGGCSHASLPNGTSCGGGNTCQNGTCAAPACNFPGGSYANSCFGCSTNSTTLTCSCCWDGNQQCGGTVSFNYCGCHSIDNIFGNLHCAF